jgi:hypothetical protein
VCSARSDLRSVCVSALRPPLNRSRPTMEEPRDAGALLSQLEQLSTDLAADVERCACVRESAPPRSASTPPPRPPAPPARASTRS